MRNGELVLPLEFLCDRSLAVALERSLPVAHGGDRQRSWRVDNVDAESSNPSYGGHMHHRAVRKVHGYTATAMFSFLSLSSALPRLRQAIAPVSVPNGTFGARFRNQIAPRKVKYAKRQKGRIPIPTGGSTRGTTLAYGEYGIRIKGQGVRFTAKQLSTAEEVIKRAIKVVKGAKVYLRVFPDIPVCIKVRS